MLPQTNGLGDFLFDFLFAELFKVASLGYIYIKLKPSTILLGFWLCAIMKKAIC
jgi:hypothetical protein